jgi:excisionase family DNA binding protein
MKLIITTPESLEEIINTSLSKALEKHYEKEKNLSTKKKNYTIKEVADELNVTILSVRNYIEKGYLQAFKIGNRVLISYESIEI